MGRFGIGRFTLNVLVAALLSACAGGGGGGGGTAVSPPTPLSPHAPPAPPPPPPSAYPGASSAEFNANWGVRGTNAQVAWQNGATGAGVLVGVVDDGVDPNHPELLGRISPNSTDIVAGRNALTTSLSHGSELSSLIAGNFNDSQTVGVAFEATILAVRADDGSSSFSYSDLANAIDYARAQGVRVINFSLGGNASPPAAFTEAVQRATQAGIIFTVSAGNSGSATFANYPGFLASDASIANGLILVAGGLNADGSLNTVSNSPGPTAPWYMVAPGWEIIVPDHGPPGAVPGFQVCGAAAGLPADLCRIQGTSYASPHVAGAVALLIDAFPGLTPAQIVDLLLNSADDLGAAGTDAVYGRGRLNIGRAFQPVGNLSAPLGGSSSVSYRTPLGVSGAAFGDALTRAGVWSVAAFDDYGRTFAVDFTANWLRAAPGVPAVAQAPLLWRTARDESGALMQMALADSVAPESMRLPVGRVELEQPAMRIDAELAPGLTATIAAHGVRASRAQDAAVGHLAVVNTDLSLNLTQRLGDAISVSILSESGAAPSGLPFSPSIAREASAARASFAFAGGGFDLTAGRLQEERGLMGLVWSNELGAVPEGRTNFAGIGAYIDAAPGVRVSLAAEYGMADLAGGWLEVAEALRTSAFSLQARAAATPRWLEGEGALTLSLTQPLRVESGLLSFAAPVADEYGRQNLSFEQRAFAPTPSGRELRLELGYTYVAGERLSAFGEAIYVHEPGHVAGADPAGVIRMGLRMAR